MVIVCLYNELILKLLVGLIIVFREVVKARRLGGEANWPSGMVFYMICKYLID